MFFDPLFKKNVAGNAESTMSWFRGYIGYLRCVRKPSPEYCCILPAGPAGALCFLWLRYLNRKFHKPDFRQEMHECRKEEHPKSRDNHLAI